MLGGTSGVELEPTELVTTPDVNTMGLANDVVHWLG